MNLRLRLVLEWLLIGSVASILVIFALSWRGIDDFDNSIYDQLSAAGRPQADDDILIVAIDDRSLAEIGKWPWPRDVHAELFEKLKRLQPRTVAFDILISEPSGNEEPDNALGAAIAGAPPVFVPLHFIFPGTDGRPYETEPPIRQLAENAAGIGQVNLSDRDEVIRRIELCFDPGNGDAQWPHLMELQFRAAAAQESSPAFGRTKCGEDLILPYAERDSFATISYADLLRSQVPDGLVRNRDVIIGATAAGMGDSHPVPFASGGLMPGVEIMANMLSTLKSDSFIRPVGGWQKIALSILPIWLLMLAFLYFPPRLALISSVAFLLLVLASSAIALAWKIWIPPAGALLGILLVYPLWGWRRLQAMSDFMENEVKQLQKEGEIGPLLNSGSPAGDIVGRQSAALGTAIDQIRDLRRFVSDVLSDLPDPMAVADNEGVVILSNDLVEQRFGESVDGMQIDEVIDAVVVPSQRKAVREHVKVTATVVPQNNEAENYIRFNSVDGRTFVMRRSPVINDKERHLGDIYYLADISALASAEAQREEVLQLLSHDMRAPQSAIIASLDGKLNKSARKRIEQNARRTMRLAQDFVDMARMTETEFAGEDILFADLVRDVADSLWPLAEERKLKIEVVDRSDSAFVLAEAEALSRAIGNLVDNAIKFSPQDSQITMTLRRIVINKSNHISLTISDEGGGIDPQILPRLFTKFASSDREQRRAKGTGLGLAFVETVATRHSGSVRAENRKGGGADFVLLLPEAEEG